MKNIISAKFFLKNSNIYYYILNIFTALFFVIGLYLALLSSPADYQQGNSVRIMYIHVPSAWISLILYFLLGLFSIGFIVFRIIMFDLIAINIAPIGFTFSFITLFTGSLWGKPIWGTWWVWDIRLTSFAILAFFFFSYISFRELSKDTPMTQRNSALFAIIGLLNLPIIKFGVEKWHSLHQPSSLFKKSGPAIDSSMLMPLFIMISSLLLYATSLAVVKIKISLYKKKIYKLSQYIVN